MLIELLAESTERHSAVRVRLPEGSGVDYFH